MAIWLVFAALWGVFCVAIMAAAIRQGRDDAGLESSHDAALEKPEGNPHRADRGDAGESAKEGVMWFEDRSTPKLGVGYGGSSKTPEAWAEHFGRKVIDGLIAGEAPPDVLGAYARLAGSFAAIALEAAAGDNHDAL